MSNSLEESINREVDRAIESGEFDSWFAIDYGYTIREFDESKKGEAAKVIKAYAKTRGFKARVDYGDIGIHFKLSARRFFKKSEVNP